MSIAHTASTTFLRRPRLRAVPDAAPAPSRGDLPAVVRPDLVPTVTGEWVEYANLDHAASTPAFEWVVRAVETAQQGDLSEAIRLLELARATEPLHRETLFLLARFYQEQASARERPWNSPFYLRSAAAIRDTVIAAFPQAAITFKIDAKRQGIVDSWPADVDDSAARADWGFRPAYDFDRAFREYLIPTIRRYYTQ